MSVFNPFNAKHEFTRFRLTMLTRQTRVNSVRISTLLCQTRINSIGLKSRQGVLPTVF